MQKFSKMYFIRNQQCKKVFCTNFEASSPSFLSKVATLFAFSDILVSTWFCQYRVEVRKPTVDCNEILLTTDVTNSVFFFAKSDWLSWTLLISDSTSSFDEMKIENLKCVQVAFDDSRKIIKCGIRSSTGDFKNSKIRQISSDIE